MIKNMLKKWLNVPEEYVPPAQDLPSYPTKEDVRQYVRDEVVRAVVEAFRDEDSYHSAIFSSYDFNNIKGTVRGSTLKIVDEYAAGKVQEEVDNLIEPEAFIDEVVKRIQNKQL